ncbi:quercetin dioxygenase-like cupin family protein [Salinibacterium sp. CAN_S4]|uniref:cupin domain-containing protein n=1 Tax=Salinibacterium sp. CAN_S4 TaxID=2787727 RepID=UPI001A2700F0
MRRPVIRRDGLIIAPLAPQESQVHTYRITYPPIGAPTELQVHDGYEWLYVLSGRLQLRLGDQDLTLARGEAAEFDTGIPHSMSAAGMRPAVVISIFNEAGVRMHTYASAVAF